MYHMIPYNCTAYWYKYSVHNTRAYTRFQRSRPAPTPPHATRKITKAKESRKVTIQSRIFHLDQLGSGLDQNCVSNVQTLHANVASCARVECSGPGQAGWSNVEGLV